MINYNKQSYCKINVSVVNNNNFKSFIYLDTVHRVLASVTNLRGRRW